MLVLFVVFDIFLILLILLLVFRIARRNSVKGRKTDHDIERTVSAVDTAESYSEAKPTKGNSSFANETPIKPSAGMSIEERKGFLGEQALYNQIKQVQDVGAKVIWDCWLRFPIKAG